MTLLCSTIFGLILGKPLSNKLKGLFNPSFVAFRVKRYTEPFLLDYPESGALY